MVWKSRVEVTCRHVPERYGSWTVLHTRFRRWAADGTIGRILRAATGPRTPASPRDGGNGR
ncbi:hypothetical protein ACFRMN_10775 [Streptomyces sp. NPDC056835]|uniref:hypothetical protein n=1 Tax=Streptomyces sp. NPDC056835 TaxID=3345956 RepID=UPI00369079FE